MLLNISVPINILRDQVPNLDLDFRFSYGGFNSASILAEEFIGAGGYSSPTGPMALELGPLYSEVKIGNDLGISEGQIDNITLPYWSNF